MISFFVLICWTIDYRERPSTIYIDWCDVKVHLFTTPTYNLILSMFKLQVMSAEQLTPTKIWYILSAYNDISVLF